MGQLGVNAHGEVLEAGRVCGCYLGLLLVPVGDGEGAGVLVVAPAALLHPSVPRPDGTVLYVSEFGTAPALRVSDSAGAGEVGGVQLGDRALP